MLKTFALLFLVAMASFVVAEEAYFKLKTYGYGGEFIFKLTDPAKIQHARELLSGATTDEPHVMGRIKKQPVSYNPGWDYHYDPNTISFFNMGIEVCDATTEYVNDHIDEACGAFLPGCFWCPWTSKIIGEGEPNSASATLFLQKYKIYLNK